LWENIRHEMVRCPIQYSKCITSQNQVLHNYVGQFNSRDMSKDNSVKTKNGLDNMHYVLTISVYMGKQNLLNKYPPRSVMLVEGHLL